MTQLYNNKNSSIQKLLHYSLTPPSPMTRTQHAKRDIDCAASPTAVKFFGVENVTIVLGKKCKLQIKRLEARKNPPILPMTTDLTWLDWFKKTDFQLPYYLALNLYRLTLKKLESGDGLCVR